MPLDAHELAEQLDLHLTTGTRPPRRARRRGPGHIAHRGPHHAGRPGRLYEAVAGALAASDSTGYRLLAEMLASHLAGTSTDVTQEPSPQAASGVPTSSNVRHRSPRHRSARHGRRSSACSTGSGSSPSSATMARGSCCVAARSSTSHGATPTSCARCTSASCRVRWRRLALRCRPASSNRSCSHRSASPTSPPPHLSTRADARSSSSIGPSWVDRADVVPASVRPDTVALVTTTRAEATRR